MDDNEPRSNIRSIAFYRMLKRAKESDIPQLVLRNGKISSLTHMLAKNSRWKRASDVRHSLREKGPSMGLFIEVTDEDGNDHIINRATILSLTRADKGKTLIKFGFAGDSYMVMAMKAYDSLRDDVVDMN